MSVYARILRTPGVAILVASTVLGRLPIGINGLAILLFVRETSGSFATAGIVAGALALGSAIGAPLQGRLVDRRGPRMLLPLATVHGTGLLCLWALGAGGAAVGVLAAVAAAAGAAIPPTSSVLRSRWPYVLAGKPRLIAGAYALDSVLIELIFVTGPLITALVVATLGPAGALGVSAACVLGGTASFLVALRRHDGPPPDRRRRAFGLGPLTSPGLRTLVITTFPVGFCLGSIEVTLPAFSQAAGEPALAGVLLALWSAASGTAGLLYGAHHPRIPLPALHLRFAVLLPLASLPLLLASSPLTMAGLAILAGLPVAPLIASRNQLVGRVTPEGTAAEAFTWPLTALIAGVSAGVGVAGSLAQAHGWSAPVLAGAGFAAAGALVLVAQRRRLEARPRPGEHLEPRPASG